jgi:HD-GYP domain-containing protein (c-di-GMP phosphodiesterase class II)
MGRPLGHGLSTSQIAVELAKAMDLGAEVLRHTQQLTLIRFLGCTTDAHETALMVGGDEIEFMSGFAPSHFGGTAEMAVALARNVGKGQPFTRRVRLIAGAFIDPDGGGSGLAGHCEVGARLADRLGLDEPVITGLSFAYERWDGRGPFGLRGDDVPLVVRIASVARDADMLTRLGQDVRTVLAKRRGKSHDPDVIDAYFQLDPEHREVDWEEVIALEPEPRAFLADTESAFTSMADFTDIKSPWTRGHSRRVAEIAEKAGDLAGVGSERGQRLRHAGLIHDLGRVGVENGIWDHAGTLAAADWERVRLHPYLTGRILERCVSLTDLTLLASSHHERLDRSGYHRQLGGSEMTEEMRILAAADMAVALTSERPHRPAFSLDEARGILEEEVGAGRLDRLAVKYVLGAHGDARPMTPSNPSGLTEREVEVLGLIARGRTNREVGDELFISPKTVGRHVENIYAKIGVSTRAGATVFAMEHGLLD